MDAATAVLVILNLMLIGLLPLVFFRRDGRFNLAWIATAAPFFFVAGVLLLGLAGGLNGFYPANSILGAGLLLLAIVSAVCSVTLIGLTIGVHRVPLALWHQQNDAPVELVTWGPYARVRHPFYTSFMLALFAACLVLPHWSTLGALIYATICLTITARGEERRLLASAFGHQYRQYCNHTGRFLPRLGGTQS